MATLDEAAAAQKAKEAEWGEYVATQVITINGTRAFNPGDPVPKSHVDSGVVAKEQVARRNTKAAEAVTGTES